MKKLNSILFLIAAFVCFSVTTTQAQSVKWPAGAATDMTSITAAGGTVAVTITNQMTYMGTIPTLTANATLSVTAPSYLKPGAILLVAVKTNGSETFTFAGALAAPTVTGSAGKTWTQGYIYNGTKFYPMGAKIQVD